MPSVDLIKSGGPCAGHCYDIYLNWQLVQEFHEKPYYPARRLAIDAAKELAREHEADLRINV